MKSKLTIHYDKVGDILYIEKCPPYKEQDSEELEDEIGVRLNPESGEIETVEINFFSQRVLDVVTKRPGQTTFEVQKWRWIVERTFGWFGRYRRLSKDYEHNPESSEAWIYIAMIHRMSRFSLPDRNKDDDLLRRPPKRTNP